MRVGYPCQYAKPFRASRAFVLMFLRVWYGRLFVLFVRRRFYRTEEQLSSKMGKKAGVGHDAIELDLADSQALVPCPTTHSARTQTRGHPHQPLPLLGPSSSGIRMTERPPLCSQRLRHGCDPQGPPSTTSS